MVIGRNSFIAIAIALMLGGCASTSASRGGGDPLERMLMGQSNLQGAELSAAITKAEAFPLGSEKNPVRVSMPTGERAYLSQLRCSDGKAPNFDRSGSTAPGPYGNIQDLYALSCATGIPATASVYMDMYHAGFKETRAVPGFTIVP
jgi:hypothetical protein